VKRGGEARSSRWHGKNAGAARQIIEKQFGLLKNELYLDVQTLI
jgi:hypothetical protein